MCEFYDEINLLDESFDINSEIKESSDILDIPIILFCNEHPQFNFSNNNETHKNTNNNNEINELNVNKTLLKKKRKRHDKYDRDNIKRKIQVFFFKFLVSLINKIILEILIKFNNFKIDNKKNIKNIQFKRLSYDFAKKIDSASFTSLRKKSIKDIFVNNTSPKLKKYSNINIYNNIIEKNEKIIQILDKPYLEFFNAFYKKVESINLNKYGFNIDISLSDIKGFEYFLIEQSKSENSDEYLKKIEECIKDEFIPNSQMFNVEKY